MTSIIISEDALFRICIDDISEGTIAGRAYNHKLEEPVSFVDIPEFFTTLDCFMDENRFPQAFQQKRIFKRGYVAAPDFVFCEDDEEKPVDPSLTGRCATFIMYVFTRQKSDWQGHIRLADEPVENAVEFSSEMELIDYMFTVLPGLGEAK